MKHINVCFWCKQPLTEYDLEIYKSIDDTKDLAAHVIGYKPCDECQKEMNSGISIMGVVTEPLYENQVPISTQSGTSVYPTGNRIVVTPEFIKLAYTDNADHIIEQKGILTNDEQVVQWMNQLEAIENETERIVDQIDESFVDDIDRTSGETDESKTV